MVCFLCFEEERLGFIISEFTSLIRQGKTESSRLTIDDMLELDGVVVAYDMGALWYFKYTGRDMTRPLPVTNV